MLIHYTTLKAHKTQRDVANNSFKFWVSRSINVFGVPALVGHTQLVAAEEGVWWTKECKPLLRGV